MGKASRLKRCRAQVPKERLLALALGRGPTGAALDLRHALRSQAATLDEMGRLLLNVCQAVPQVCRCDAATTLLYPLASSV